MYSAWSRLANLIWFNSSGVHVGLFTIFWYIDYIATYIEYSGVFVLFDHSDIVLTLLILALRSVAKCSDSHGDYVVYNPMDISYVWTWC